MKSNKEILICLRDNIGLLKNGLCWLSFVLYNRGEFTKAEYDKAIKFISVHRPKNYKYGKYYFWPAGEKEPRLQWIEEQLKKL